LAEILAHPIEFMVEHFQLPHSVVGILIALIVLLPESLSAILAARKNNLQKSLNLSLGSALATVGLTLPVLSFISLVSGWELALGLETVYTLLLFVSFLLVMQILQTEKSNLFGGILLIMLFSVYLFITIFN
jgi:Ca2+:H+ antiporter